jgi:hypothetical protein
LNILKRFRNEITVLLVATFAIYAVFYKISISDAFTKKQQEIRESIDEINRIVELKKFWKDKTLHKKALKLKSIVSKSKVKLFKKRTKSINVKYKNLNPNELNKIIKIVVKNPFIIEDLKIKKEGKELYSMELICRW